MNSRFKILFFALAYFIAVFANANDLKKADALYDRGKIKEALAIYLKPEHSSKAIVQNRLGNLYLKEGFRDEKKSVEWFKKSAEQDNKHGQYNLGLSYQDGIGVKRDYAKAMEFLNKAAAQGNASAMNAIGIQYENGLGVKKDEKEAARWYAKAVNEGNLDGMCNASGLIMHGKDVEKNYDNAHQMLNRCLKDTPNNDCCLDRMAELYSMGWGVKKDRKKARELREKAAANGSEVAMYNLGADYDYGIGVDKDPKAAMDWYLKAAEKGESNALYRLYEIHEYGKLEQPVDKAKAEEWKARAEAAMKEAGISRNGLMDKLRLGMED